MTVAVLAIASILFVMAAGPTMAVPAFTRKTGMDCAACHFGGTNRLTAMGNQFLVRGHRMPGDEGAYAKSADIKLTNYLSFSSKVRFTAQKDVNPSTKFDVESLSIYSGGPLTNKYSYFFEYYLHEAGSEPTKTGGAGDSATRTKLADAYLQYNTNPEGDSYFYARAGQIYPYLIYTYGSGGRVSIGRPRAINANVGGLADHENLFTPRDRAYGASVGGLLSDSIYLESGVVNSGGGNARPNLQETNNTKDVFLTAQKMLDEYGSNVGFYGYSGAFLTLPTGGPGSYEDHFTRWGLVAALQRHRFEISGVAFFGNNDDPVGGGRRSPKGSYIEGAYNVRPDLTVYARYDNQDNDLGIAPATKKQLRRATGSVFGISKRLGLLGRIVTEVELTRNDKVNSGGTASGKSSDRVWTTELNWLF